MASYLVPIVVTDPDDETARRIAQAVSDLAAEVVGLGEGETETFIGDPTLVVT